jgi:hypothetical protein
MERNIDTEGLHLISAYRDVVYCHPQSGFRIVVTVGEFDNSVEIFDERSILCLIFKMLTLI